MSEEQRMRGVKRTSLLQSQRLKPHKLSHKKLFNIVWRREHDVSPKHLWIFFTLSNSKLGWHCQQAVTVSFKHIPRCLPCLPYCYSFSVLCLYTILLFEIQFSACTFPPGFFWYPSYGSAILSFIMVCLHNPLLYCLFYSIPFCAMALYPLGPHNILALLCHLLTSRQLVPFYRCGGKRSEPVNNTEPDVCVWLRPFIWLSEASDKHTLLSAWPRL